MPLGDAPGFLVDCWFLVFELTMVAISTQMLTALLFAGVALAMPVEEKRQGALCTNPIVRKSW